MSDLFAAAAKTRLESRSPLAARLRPKSLDDVVGQQHLIGPDAPLRRLVDADRLSSVILWGPAGTGKTTMARLVAEASSKELVQLSAVNASVKDVRAVIAAAEERLGAHGRGTILFLDEVHRFNKAQQDALLPAVESGVLTLIGATTENPFFEVNAPLRSRSTLFRLEPLEPDELATLLRRGLAYEGAEATDEAIDYLAGRAAGDGRQALTTLEVAVALAAAERDRDRDAERDGARSGDDSGGAIIVSLADAEAATDLKALRYGRDEHYDVISAFIKSIRGSDPDAAIYWLARMLSAGEDPRFIARRLIIAASEDVGMADPMSLLVAEAASRAVDFVGLPEARINLAQATVHLATAPKSNASYSALNAAMADVQERPAGEVPVHLRDSSYQGAASLGHGQGYRYPHDHPDGWIEQDYLPDGMTDTRYYRPTNRGYEAGIARRGAPDSNERDDAVDGTEDEGQR
jgi:putative ATPase